MDVSKPEFLERESYRFARNVDVPEAIQENDVDGDFTSGPPSAIPDFLQEEIQRVSVDPEAEAPPEKSIDVEKVAEENPQSRFRILDLAIRKPGVCFVCRSDGNDERQFVDFGKTVEWYGVVYICTFCASEVAKLLNFVPSGELEEISGLHIAVSQRDCEIELLKEQLNAARVLLRNCRCGDSDSSDSVTYPVQVDVESNPEPEPNFDDPDESGDVKESGDVPEASVDDDGVAREVPVEIEKPKRTRRGSASS